MVWEPNKEKEKKNFLKESPHQACLADYDEKINECDLSLQVTFSV